MSTARIQLALGTLLKIEEAVDADCRKQHAPPERHPDPSARMMEARQRWADWRDARVAHAVALYCSADISNAIGNAGPV